MTKQVSSPDRDGGALTRLFDAWVGADAAWFVVPLAGCAWMAMGWDASGLASALGSAREGAWPLCLAAGTDAPKGIVPWTVLVPWVLMVTAMVPPMSAGLLRYVALRSLRARRYRAMTLSLGGVLGVWLAGGMAAAPVIAALLAAWPIQALCVAAYFLAAAWQFAPLRRRAVRRCHRVRPLAGDGWAADRDCFVLGVARGGDCLLACGPMMLAGVLSGHALLGMAVMAVIAQAERWARDPAPGPAAVILACLAVVYLPV
ncbi:MAG TPA: DUF2182 domain-containing protein [Rhodopila sp.]|uniref:copper chaperone n=1 Tax=Rhodopila sp. TaxID=2480087 RepID=UPI002C36FD2C|nr:DUF2182 domain-containing protein [Rhodopila sp.]HVY13614.1 DUF2182 domain-containing protein [Rhodopila sp.]